jgi:hypothetical protein
MEDDEIREAVKHRVRQRKRSLWLQGHPIEARRLETGAQRRARTQQTAQPVRPRPLLTPLPQRLALMKAGKVQLTTLDRMLDDDQARALERWALCEELLHGSAKAVSFDGGSGGSLVRSPIHDEQIKAVHEHMRFRKRLPCHGVQFRLLAAFTAIQNGVEGALSPAQYGLRFYPRATNKRMAFLDGIAETACGLTGEGY